MEVDGYKSHRGGIKLFNLDYFSTEVIFNFSVIEDLFESFLVKQVVPSLDNMYRPPNKPLAYFHRIITGTLEYTHNYRAVFTGDFNVDIMNHTNMTRNYTDVLSPV